MHHHPGSAFQPVYPLHGNISNGGGGGLHPRHQRQAVPSSGGSDAQPGVSGWRQEEPKQTPDKKAKQAKQQLQQQVLQQLQILGSQQQQSQGQAPGSGGPLSSQQGMQQMPDQDMRQSVEGETAASFVLPTFRCMIYAGVKVNA